MDSLYIALCLTAEGIKNGKIYDQNGYILYMEKGMYGAKSYIIFGEDKYEKFNDAMTASFTFIDLHCGPAGLSATSTR